LLLIVSRLEYGRPFFLPPEVPAARVEALRRAFDASVKDPEYLAEAEKQQLEVSPMTGEDVAALIRKVAQTPPDIVARVRAALESGGK
jgi:tripartite-type tricarboxylate transporter receptor subunit TctC